VGHSLKLNLKEDGDYDAWMVKTEEDRKSGLQDGSVRTKRQVSIILGVLGFVSDILGIYDHISSNKWEYSDVQNYDQQFNEVHDQLQEIDAKLDQVMAEINVGFVKTILAPDLKIISDCDFSLRRYLDCLDINYNDEDLCLREKSTFINNAEGATSNQLESAIRHVMDSMAGNYPGNDIPQTYRIALENYEYKLEEQLDQWLAWVNSGIYIHAAYVEVNAITEAQNSFFRSYLNSTYNTKMPEKRESEFELCRDESDVPKEINQVLKDCQGLKNPETATKLSEMLGDKYRTKKWFTAVYNDISGNNNHYFNSAMPSSLNQWGKNAIVYSIAGEPSITPTERDYLHQHIDDNNSNAQTAYNDLYRGTGYKLILAVIKRGSGLATKISNGYVDNFYEDGQFWTVIGLPLSINIYHSGSLDSFDSDAVIGQ